MINAYLNTAIEKHVVAESTNIGATNYAKHIYNVVASVDIDNGKLVNLTDMKYYKNATTKGLIVTGTAKGSVLGEDKYANGECFTMVAPTDTAKLGLILSVETPYDERPAWLTYEENFYNAKGEVMRVYELMEGDRFTVSSIGITALGTKPVVGNFVVADGYDITEVAGPTAPTGKAFYGEIIEEINRTNDKFYKIVVRKNG